MISHSCTCRATEDGTPNLRSPRRKRSEAQAICAQDDFDFQQNPIMIFFLLESEESLKQILFQFPSSTAPIILYRTVLLAELHMLSLEKRRLLTRTAAMEAKKMEDKKHSTKPFICHFSGTFLEAANSFLHLFECRYSLWRKRKLSSSEEAIFVAQHKHDAFEF